MRRTVSATASASERSDLRNFNRAGVAKNRSVTSMRVPWPEAAGLTGPFSPAVTVMAEPAGLAALRVTMSSRATEPIDGKASPRKPSVRMAERSPVGSLEVACRSTQSARSSGDMPAPSSTTRINCRPPARMVISMAEAPASSALSTSSLTAAAGRSITSPAAI
jgi:hypothetical protein